MADRRTDSLEECYGVGRMPRTSTIRFVGGPWHNRLEACELVPTAAVVMKSEPCSSVTYISKEYYHLALYRTNQGTEYYQYVHGSLVNGSTALPCTHHERFPKWVLDKRQLDSRLRRILK